MMRALCLLVCLALSATLSAQEKPTEPSVNPLAVELQAARDQLVLEKARALAQAREVLAAADAAAAKSPEYQAWITSAAYKALVSAQRLVTSLSPPAAAPTPVKK